MRSENIQKWVSVSWCPYNQSYGFSSSHIWMWELDHKEVWMLKNWCFRIMVLEKTLQSPLDCKEIKPVNPKGNQPWIFIARMNAEAPILWSPDAKSWLIWKDSDAGKDWRQKEKGEPSMRGLDSIADSMDISSVQFSRSVMSDSLRSHGLQHARLPCPFYQLPELIQIQWTWIWGNSGRQWRTEEPGVL